MPFVAHRVHAKGAVSEDEAGERGDCLPSPARRGPAGERPSPAPPGGAAAGLARHPCSGRGAAGGGSGGAIPARRCPSPKQMGGSSSLRTLFMSFCSQGERSETGAGWGREAAGLC